MRTFANGSDDSFLEARALQKHSAKAYGINLTVSAAIVRPVFLVVVVKRVVSWLSFVFRGMQVSGL